MGVLRQLWKDFLKNYDVYIVILFSLLTLGLSYFSAINTITVISLTTIMLGLIAVSIRRDRQVDEKTTDALQKLSNEIVHTTKYMMFKHQIDAYHFLIGDIKQHGAKKAILLQYSSTMAYGVIAALLEQRAEVTIYIQHEAIPKSLRSQTQVARIVAIQKLPEHLGDLFKGAKLKIYKHRCPVSVSGIKIDDRVLCMGWYTYEYSMNKRIDAKNMIEVSGHDRAAVIVWRGTDEFAALDETFTALKNNYEQFSEEVPLDSNA
ncbi:MAG: hypothetical protein NVS4B7_21520 [Ktedonobacteraceae bacterium]